MKPPARSDRNFEPAQPGAPAKTLLHPMANARERASRFFSGKEVKPKGAFFEEGGTPAATPHECPEKEAQQAPDETATPILGSSFDRLRMNGAENIDPFPVEPLESNRKPPVL